MLVQAFVAKKEKIFFQNNIFLLFINVQIN